MKTIISTSKNDQRSARAFHIKQGRVDRTMSKIEAHEIKDRNLTNNGTTHISVERW